MSNGFMFRFTSQEMRKEFHLVAVNQNKSMNKLLNEIVTSFLNGIKENEG